MENKPMTMADQQASYVAEITNSTAKLGIPLTDYAKTCVFTAVGAVFSYVKEKGITLGADVDITAFKTNLQYVALTQLNIANGELFIDYRKGWSGHKGTLKLTIQGNGWESIVNRYGQGVAKNGLQAPWIVRDGDRFVKPLFKGLKVTDPEWDPVYDSSKSVLYVVYPLKKRDGKVEWLISDRAGTKASLISHIHNSGKSYFRANGDQQELLDKALASLTADEILDKGNAFIDSCLGIKRNDQTPVFISPAWISPSSREGMLIRKMKNNALKKYPLDLSDPALKTAIESMDEDRDETVVERKNVVSVQGGADSNGVIDDFSVPAEDGKPEEPKPEEPKPEEPKPKEPKPEDSIEVGDLSVQPDIDDIADDKLPF